jgi:arylsulfatase A-like enzyme
MRRAASVMMAAFAITVSATSVVLTAGSASARGRPNIVLIVTDDQRADALGSMPTVRRQLKARGTWFSNAFAPNPLCCPSRASILTGLHSHHTGVYDNAAPNGGFAVFDDRVTVATVLQGAGYRTAYIGKYLNGYSPTRMTYVPPGWDRWFAFGNGAYYRYRASADGEIKRYGSREAHYSARVMTRQARSFIRADPNGERFFLVLSSAAAHGSRRSSDEEGNMPIPSRRDLGRLDGIKLWRPESYGLRDDVSDMPLYIQQRGWNEAHRERIDLFRQRQLEALSSFDRQISRLLKDVPKNTLVIFLSDNGYMWGEHRWMSKRVPYEESIRIPLIMRWPGRVPVGEDRRLALNIDIAPTLLSAAGLPRSTPTGIDVTTDSPVRADGTSLLSRHRIRAFPLEHFNSGQGIPAYCGIRTRNGWMYVRYWQGGGSPDNGFEELYRVRKDPLQRRNLSANPSFDEERLNLRERARELCDPPPPGYEWGG